MYNFHPENAVICKQLRSDHKYSNEMQFLWIIELTEVRVSCLQPCWTLTAREIHDTSLVYTNVLRKIFIKSLNSAVSHSVMTISTSLDLRWRILLTTLSAYTETFSHLSPSLNGADLKEQFYILGNTPIFLLWWVRWKNWYHYRACMVNMKLQLAVG